MDSESNQELESDDNDCKKQQIDDNYQDFIEDQKKKYKCKFPGCEAAFPRPSRLQRHVNVHTNERPYKCTLEGCDRAYTNSSHLKRHLETHKPVDKSFHCHVCKTTTSTLSNLKRHFKRAHNSSRELYCLECQTWFTKKNRFDEHMRMHENSSTFKCEKCGKVFKTHVQLINHQTKHHEQKKTYKCPFENCTEVFDKWMSMLTHKRTQHTTEYSCSVCSKTFAFKGHLKAHSKIHSEDRATIACPYEKCSRLYYFRKNLNAHIRSKHQGNKFNCDMCSTELSSKQKIREHIIKKHMTEPKPFKRKPVQAPRKDTGTAKVSVIPALTGLELGVKAGMQLMKRKPVALLRDKVVDDSYSSYSEDDKAPSRRTIRFKIQRTTCVN